MLTKWNVYFEPCFMFRCQEIGAILALMQFSKNTFHPSILQIALCYPPQGRERKHII